MGKTIQWWLSVILGWVTLITAWNLLAMFRPNSGNHILLINCGTDTENARNFVVKLRSDTNSVVFEESVRLGSNSGSLRILEFNRGYFNGSIELIDVETSNVWKTDFLPPGRYGQTAVVSLYDMHHKESLRSNELKCSFNFLPISKTSTN